MLAVQVIPDRWNGGEKIAGKKANAVAGGGPGGEAHVRRPTRGIVLKEETFATMRCVTGDGRVILLTDAGSRRKDPVTGEIYEQSPGVRGTDIYSNFLLQQVQEDRMEKQQILETFGEAFIFLFGERARVITFAGVLMNTFDFNWEAEWWENYENYLRGTRCVENDARVYLSFDNTIVGGYILGTSSSKNAQERGHVNFQFQLFVTSYANFSAIGNPNADPSVTNGGTYLGLGDEFDATYRPVLVPPIEDEIRAFNPQSPDDDSFFDAVGKAIGTVRKAVDFAQEVAGKALQYYGSNLINGEVVRIPIGFAGTMEYDTSDALQKTQVVTQSGVIKYTTFDQNTDEYVGAGDHYGSALFMQGVHLSTMGLTETISRGEGMTKEAKKIWEEKGFMVPDLALGPVARLLVSGGLGLLAGAIGGELGAKETGTKPGGFDAGIVGLTAARTVTGI